MNTTYQWQKTSERLPVINEVRQIVYRNKAGNIGVFMAHPERKLLSDPNSFYEWLEELPSSPTAEGETAEAIRFEYLFNKYQEWCKITHRNGAVLIGSSIKEFFKWVSQFPEYAKQSIPVSIQNEFRAQGWDGCHAHIEEIQEYPYGTRTGAYTTPDKTTFLTSLNNKNQ